MAYCAGMKKSFWHGAFWFVFALAFFIQSARAVETPPKIYRMKQWEEAKKRAIAEDKPIAWIGAPARCLAPYQKNLLGKGSHAATKYAIHTLEKEAILIFSDAETENHQEPRIVDQALHSPDPHYNIPGVIILTPSLDKVITKTFYKADGNERRKEFSDSLKKIRDKASWQEKKSAK